MRLLPLKLVDFCLQRGTPYRTSTQWRAFSQEVTTYSLADTSGAVSIFFKIADQLASQLSSSTSGETPAAKKQSLATKASFADLAAGFQQVKKDMEASQDEEGLEELEETLRQLSPDIDGLYPDALGAPPTGRVDLPYKIFVSMTLPSLRSFSTGLGSRTPLRSVLTAEVLPVLLHSVLVHVWFGRPESATRIRLYFRVIEQLD